MAAGTSALVMVEVESLSLTLLAFLAVGGGESKTLLESSVPEAVEAMFLLERLNVGGVVGALGDFPVLLTDLALLVLLILTVLGGKVSTRLLLLFPKRFAK